MLASNEASRDAHRELYHFTENRYIIAGEGILDSVLGVDADLKRLHISSPWNDIVRLATWKSEPRRSDIFLLLMNAGVVAGDLTLLRDSELPDIFPWLFYGKKLDVLRKICRNAKANAEMYIGIRGTRVYCHMISEDTKSIIASSL